MLHLGCFVYLVNVGLLLVHSLIIHIGVCLKRHPISLCLQLLIRKLEGRPLRTQVDAFVGFDRALGLLGRARLTGQPIDPLLQVRLLFLHQLLLYYIVDVRFLANDLTLELLVFVGSHPPLLLGVLDL